jgi:hypothetical protein
VVADRDELHALHRSDQLRQVRQGPAELAGERAQQQVPLLGRGALVDQGHDLPVAGQDIAGDVGDQHQVEPGDVDAADPALVEAVRDDGEALPEVGVLPDPARTVDPARARLDQRPHKRIHRVRLGRGLLGLGHGRSFWLGGALLRRCLSLKA